MAFFEIRFLNKEEDETSWYADFEEEAQESINELLEEGRTILNVYECRDVTKCFNIDPNNV